MTSVRVDAAALNSSLRRLAQQDDDSDLTASLRRVIDFSSQLFTVTGGGLMLADEGGELHYIIASTGPSHLLEEVQIETGEGPCVDTYVRDEMTITRDLARDERYPVLAPLVVPHGIGAVMGVPVHLSDVPIGSLDLYVDHPYDFDESEMVALTRFGEVVEAMIGAAVTASHAGELADQLAYALDYRAPIERGPGPAHPPRGLPEAPYVGPLDPPQDRRGRPEPARDRSPSRRDRLTAMRRTVR
jgi:GAF domain-containing protein